MSQLDDRTNQPDDLSVGRAALDALLDRVSDLVVSCDGDGTIVYVSPSARILTGFASSDAVGRNILDFIHPDEHGAVLEGLSRWQDRSGAPRGQVQRLRASDGSWIEIDYDSVIDDLALGDLGTIVITARPSASFDTDQSVLVQRLLNEDRLVRLATIFVEHGPDEFEEGVEAAVGELSALDWVTRVSVWRATHDGRNAELHTHWVAPADAPRTHLPSRFTDAFPHMRNRLVELEEVHVRSVEHLPDDWSDERAVLSAAGVRSLLAIPMSTADRFRGLVMVEVTVESIEFDITHLSALRSASAILAGAFERNTVEQAMLYEARHDPLTGLENRWALEERLAGILAELRSGKDRPAGVALLNLDHFASVNEALGREAGDRVLRVVASRLTSVQAWTPELARVQGDEFVAIWRDVEGSADLRDRVDALVSVLDAPLDVDGSLVSVTTSTGASLLDRDSGDVGEVLRRLDVACRRARTVGGDWVEVDEGAATTERLVHMHQSAELRAAIDTPAIEVYYQGEWDMLNQRLVGAEALVRWNHPARGVLSAASFIHLAEASGVIDRLGAQVLRTACESAVHWPTIAGAEPVVRVNLSPNQLLRQDVVAMVRDVLAETALPPHRLALELTENALLVDPERAVAVLHGLRDLGVGLSIDDFGTGYSSLLYLKRLPVTSLKIDKAFVDGVEDDDDDRAIVEVVIRLADTFGLPVTAEGVEHEGQAEALRGFGCVLAQGYLFSRPEPEADFVARLRAG